MLGARRARARDGGLADGRRGAVAVMQRFGGALNLNAHVHALVLDGVFARNRGARASSSTCILASSCRRGSGIGSSACAATHCVRRRRMSGST